MGCNSNDCLNCKHPVCLLDLEEEKPLKPKKEPKKDRNEYMRKYYQERKKHNVHCAWCDKKCTGEMIRIDAKKFCGINCVLCHLYEKNEKRMKIIVV